jgi:hypothetical protein
MILPMIHYLIPCIYDDYKLRYYHLTKKKPEIICWSQFCFHFHASLTSKVVVSFESNSSSTIANFQIFKMKIVHHETNI